jgi:hypothetical protein
MAAHGAGQRRCSPWRPRTPIYPFQIHTYSERTTELQPPCIYSMLKHELPRVGPRLRCVWNTNPLHMNSKADLVPLHSPVKCNDAMTRKTLRSLWHLVPKFIRVQCYRVLLKLGSYLYPRSFTGLVHRLPFGLYAKECSRSDRNEAEALRLVEQYTSSQHPSGWMIAREHAPFLSRQPFPDKR